MRKIFIFLLIVSFLVLGALSVIEEFYETPLCDIAGFSESGSFEEPEECDSEPKGGPIGGGGPAPG